MNRNDIQRTIDALTDIYLSNTPWSADLARAKTEALSLLKQFDEGDYIEIEPPLNGFGYVTVFYPDASKSPERLGHDGWQSVALYAVLKNKPLVVDHDWDRRWVEHIVRRLTEAGFTVIIDGED